jgi:hypothetical protein
VVKLKLTKQKAPGNSGITKRHIIQLPNATLIQLITIFNLVLSTGHYPKIWKEALMIFLPKPGKVPFEHVNYRPISLLEVPGKLLEKIINRRIIKIIEERGLSNPRQHVFTPNRGTHTATAILYETIATARGNDEKLEIILRDISRAFDEVWHDGLRDKIRLAELPDCMTRLLSSYNTDRTASIRIGDFYGPNLTLKGEYLKEVASHQRSSIYARTICQHHKEDTTTSVMQTISRRSYRTQESQQICMLSSRPEQ